VLGLTSYQEALRALGSLLEAFDRVRIAEHPAEASVEISTPQGKRGLGAAELEDLVLTSHARRGGHLAAGSTSDLLRAVGRALDELHASDVCLQLATDTLAVTFRDEHAASHELTYAGEELEALRRAAVARRNGQPLRRVLILQGGAQPTAPIVELLVAEFAVQALPTLYARAVAAGAEPPDLILALGGPDLAATIGAIEALRASQRTSGVPIVVMPAAATPADNLSAAFAAGADDLLPDPTLPAQLRARLRTWMLRKPVGG
jgi:CheY-like chemotaxis protein